MAAIPPDCTGAVREATVCAIKSELKCDADGAVVPVDCDDEIAAGAKCVTDAITAGSGIPGMPSVPGMPSMPSTPSVPGAPTTLQ